jgi:bacillolysin/thermolysin
MFNTLHYGIYHHRILYLGLSLSLIPAIAIGAQRQHPDKMIQNNRFGTVELMMGNFSSSSSSNLEQSAHDFIAGHSKQFKLQNPFEELIVKQTSVDNLGFTHVRFEQTYKNIPVFGCQKIVHFNEDRDIYLVAGQTIPTPNVSIDPKLSENSAEQIAINSIMDEPGSDNVHSSIKKTIYPSDGIGKLAWLVDVLGRGTIALHWRVFVDAHDGEILNLYNAVCTDGPLTGTGQDLFGNTRSFNTYQTGSAIEMIDATRPEFVPPVDNLEGVIVTFWDFRNGGGVVTDPNGDNVFDDDPGYPGAVTGHYWAEQCYEYFRDNFGWIGWDNAGGSISCNVHDASRPNNAYMTIPAPESGHYPMMGFGDGDGITYGPFLDPDIIGHEFTHGVTYYAAGLIYQFESGALHETMSDFFGNMIDGTNWVIADKTVIAEPGWLRNMEDPHHGYPPNRFPFGTQPAHMSEFVVVDRQTDNGGVHSNSGIPNRVGFLVGSSIGRSKAEQIWFRCLETYLTPWSSFNFWAEMLTISTVDLYGSPGPELDAVSAGLDSVGFSKLFPFPLEITDMTIPNGSLWDTTITLTSRSITPFSVTSVNSANDVFAISGLTGSEVVLGQNVSFTVGFDATSGFGDCDLGFLGDTIIIATTSVEEPLISIPIDVRLGITHTLTGVDTISASCLIMGLNKHPGFESIGLPHIRIGWFQSAIIPGVGSPIFGVVYDTDTIIYQGYGSPYVPRTYPEANLIATDDWSIQVAPNGFSLYDLPFMSFDGQITGKVRYQVDPSSDSECEYITAEYWLTNNCSDPKTIISGFHYGDAELYKNATVIPEKNMILSMGIDTFPFPPYFIDTNLFAVALLNMPARNLRQIQEYRPSTMGTYDPGTVYRQMDKTDNYDALPAYDMRELITFDKNTLAYGQTVYFRTAIINTWHGEQTVYDILDNIEPPVCCIGTMGNVDCEGIIDIGDVTTMIRNLFITLNDPCCEAAADIDQSGIIDIGDLTMLIQSLFITLDPVPECP